MFQRNHQHRQPAMFSSIYELQKKQLKRLERSWAGTFYREFFRRVEEDLFAVLYSDEPSGPTILAQGNMLVRYALGYRDLKEGLFELRTLYNFRRRITGYMQRTGISLIEKALCPGSWTFEQVRDEQTEAFELKTG